jgi:hypothetical protein
MKRTTDRDLAQLCHGQECYAEIDYACRNDPATVVPAHSNQLIHGKGMGLKADHEKTAPVCAWCHYELDQGMTLTKEQKKEIWQRAYERWLPVRELLIKRREEGASVNQSEE